MNKTLLFYSQRVVFPLFIGSIGGLLFYLLKLPAAWLSGGVIAITLATLMGMPVAFPKPIKDVTFVFLGLIMGAAVSPETVNRMGQWPLSLVLLTITMVAITIAVMIYLKAIGKDHPSAFFASIPGALSYVIALASGYESVNQRFVALFQSVRLLALVVILPGGLALAGLSGSEAIKPTLILKEAGILIAAGWAFGIFCEKIKVPSGLLIGSMIMSAVLYGMGIVTGEFAPALQALCFLLMALLIGDRFNGATFKEVALVIKPCMVGFIISLFVAIIGSVMASYILNLPLGQVLLAFAPGGIEGMLILAFLFDADPAYVGAHHLARFLGIALILPFAANAFLKKS